MHSVWFESVHSYCWTISHSAWARYAHTAGKRCVGWSKFPSVWCPASRCKFIEGIPFGYFRWRLSDKSWLILLSDTTRVAFCLWGYLKSPLYLLYFHRTQRYYLVDLKWNPSKHTGYRCCDTPRLFHTMWCKLRPLVAYLNEGNVISPLLLKA